MKTVKLTEVLDYYDGIQIFAAQDPGGGHYVGEMIDTEGDFDRYTVVGVRPERRDDFRDGRVDLRTLLLESPSGEWYIAVADGAIDDPLALQPQPTPLAESDYLPDAGYFLESGAASDDAVSRNAPAPSAGITVNSQDEAFNLDTVDQELRIRDTDGGGHR